MDILSYALLANDVYGKPPTIGNASGSARVLIHQTGDGLVFGFPGTNNEKCVETDIDAIIHDAGEMGHVHRGAYASLESIWKGLACFAPTVIYGHSLGGMLAILCAARLCLVGRPPKTVYAYEPAKVSVDEKLKNIFSKYGVSVFIIRNGNDIIPLIPNILFQNWQHCADVISLGKPTFFFPNINDHLMKNVIIGIKSHLEDQKE